MQEFKDRVAVVTGGASGIGLAMARRFAGEGMKVVLADIEEEPLARAEAALKQEGATTLAVRANVMEAGEVERLAEAAYSAFGAVHVVCNNAGVCAMSAGAAIWEVPLDDWRWVLGVNVMGVVHGIHAFVPRMLAAGEEGHIVNTASGAGLFTPALGAYTPSKHAVVAVTEQLYKDLRARQARVSASVLCPGLVNTKILETERNRPATFGERVELADLPAERRVWMQAFMQGVAGGRDPDEMARMVCDAIRDDQFYIVPEENLEAARLRGDDIVNLRNPAAG
jgi:NAD(P)-dependent dehydrogenase (short-subunit alcohol dehydrogenase family)